MSLLVITSTGDKTAVVDSHFSYSYSIDERLKIVSEPLKILMCWQKMTLTLCTWPGKIVTKGVHLNLYSEAHT